MNQYCLYLLTKNDSSASVRNAPVRASQGNYSKYEYPERIFGTILHEDNAHAGITDIYNKNTF